MQHSSEHIHIGSKSEQDSCLIVEEKKNSFNQDNAQLVAQKVHFLVPRCFSCKEEMQFVEGDVIYGDKWYHHSCWADLEKVELESN